MKIFQCLYFGIIYIKSQCVVTYRYEYSMFLSLIYAWFPFHLTTANLSFCKLLLQTKRNNILKYTIL